METFIRVLSHLRDMPVAVAERIELVSSDESTPVPGSSSGGGRSQTYVSEGMEKAVTMSDKYVLILQRQADGAWRWTVVIYNWDAPLPQPEQP
jgi:hypothetical protein